MEARQPKRLYRRGCTNNQRLSKATFLAMLPDSAKEYFEGLDDDGWTIESFNTSTREACVKLHASSGDRMVSYTLPLVVWN